VCIQENLSVNDHPSKRVGFVSAVRVKQIRHESDYRFLLRARAKKGVFKANNNLTIYDQFSKSAFWLENSSKQW
jgi:hypothetical protein